MDSDFDFRRVGEFPRRVQSDDQLAQSGGMSLLAPFPGIARYNSESNTIHIKLEGGIRFGVREREGISNSEKILAEEQYGDNRFKKFLQLLDNAGIPSLDYPGRKLSDLIRSVIRFGSSQVILSRVEYTAGIDWSYLFSQRKPAGKELSSFLSSVIPGVEKVHLFPSRMDSGGSGGVWFPEMVAARILTGNGQFSLTRNLEEQGVLYIGPATMWALMDLLFENRPFTHRLVAFTFHDSVSRKSTRSQMYSVPVGYGLAGMLSDQIGDFDAVSVYNGTFGKKDQREVSIEQLENFNPYSDAVFNIVKKGAGNNHTASRGPCSGCSLCERSCPVNASPLSIVTGLEHRFRADRCLICGVCEDICPGGVGLMERIRELTAENH